jgi:hypothetical protein
LPGLPLTLAAHPVVGYFGMSRPSGHRPKPG